MLKYFQRRENMKLKELEKEYDKLQIKYGDKI